MKDSHETGSREGYSVPVENKPNLDEESNSSSSGDENSERGNWNRKLEYMLACIGYAVGLGNLWRFPYLCMRNGGGAFLVPYFFFMFVCGMPLFFLELSMGQFASLSPMSLWKVCPLFKGIGWSMAIVSGICTIYYNMVIGWALYYLGHSFVSELPWATCNNPWNTPHCVQRGGILGGMNDSSSNSTNMTMPADSTLQPTTGSSNMSRTPSEEFWQFQMLEMSKGIHDMGGIKWQLFLCLLGAWVMVFLCLCKGVKSTGKVVYFTATIPYILLSILFIRGCMLPGAVDGIKYYLVPDFNRLKDIHVWVEACLQIFFSLGPAWGGLITMASYNKFNNNCYRDAVTIPLINSGTSFYAGFVVFSVIGFMAHEAGVPVEEVITQGPGLAFIAYPEAITKLPVAPFWAVLFFLMVLTLGLDTQFGMVETLTSGFVDTFPRYLANKRTLFTGFVCFVELMIGLPLCARGGLYVFQIMDWYCAAFSLVIIAMLECLVIGHIYGVKRVYYDIEVMIGYQPCQAWKVCWMFITPIILLIMLIVTCIKIDVPAYGNYDFPPWAVAIGWMIALSSVVPIPIVMLIEILQAKGSILQRIKHLLKPDEQWGPALDKDRSEYKYCKQGQQKELYSTAVPLNYCPELAQQEDCKTKL